VDIDIERGFAVAMPEEGEVTVSTIVRDLRRR
jgi:hypothetical protein